MSRAPQLVDLALARGTVDRAGQLRDATLLQRLLKDDATRVLELTGDEALTAPTEQRGPAEDGWGLRLRPPEPDDTVRLALFLGVDAGPDAPPGAGGAARPGGGTAYLAVVRQDGAHDDGPRANLRQVGALLGPRDAGLFTTGQALANWHRTHPHCPRCGSPTEPADAGWTRRCTMDGSEHYPRTDPAVIMSVLDAEDRLLLARGTQWPQGRVSVLAGFVEPGEPLEAAVVREVREEVGLVVDDVRYLGNQPWPFPASLMVGFSARAAGTRLRPDLDEIADAAWWTREELAGAVSSGRVVLSSSLSIARRLIEHWYGGPLREPDAD